VGGVAGVGVGRGGGCAGWGGGGAGPPSRDRREGLAESLSALVTENATDFAEVQVFTPTARQCDVAN
jgi:hypothetical protein